MSHNAASEEAMGLLHAAVAQRLTDELEKEDTDPRVITAAIAFLNNNKVVMNPFITEALSDIEKRLMSKTTKFKVVGDSQAAAEKSAAMG